MGVIFIVYGYNIRQFHLKPYSFLSVVLHCICWLWVQLILNISPYLQRNVVDSVIPIKKDKSGIGHQVGQKYSTIIRWTIGKGKSDCWLLRFIYNPDWVHVAILKIVKLRKQKLGKKIKDQWFCPQLE